MSFFSFGTGPMSRTELDAFARSAREWAHDPVPVVQAQRDVPVRRPATEPTDVSATEDAATLRPRPSAPSVAPWRIATRVRRALLERSKRRVVAS